MYKYVTRKFTYLVYQTECVISVLLQINQKEENIRVSDEGLHTTIVMGTLSTTQFRLH